MGLVTEVLCGLDVLIWITRAADVPYPYRKVNEHCSIPNISIAQRSVRLTVLKQQLLKNKCLAFLSPELLSGWVHKQKLNSSAAASLFQIFNLCEFMELIFIWSSSIMWNCELLLYTSSSYKLVWWLSSRGRAWVSNSLTYYFVIQNCCVGEFTSKRMNLRPFLVWSVQVLQCRKLTTQDKKHTCEMDPLFCGKEVNIVK